MISKINQLNDGMASSLTFFNHAGSGFGASRTLSGAIFSNQNECEAEILNKLQSEDHLTVGKNASGGRLFGNSFA